uniref:Trafficking protein particle complex subunit 11 n=1 Tax=Amblyomma sculptum TaxID=1581419 RepID=A0A1E1XLT0_AMBSC
MKPLEIGEVPDELKSRPKAFVAFIGLDPQGSNIHAAIWDAFSNNRGPDRAPLNLVMLPEKHVFPKPKPKHPSYERYEERGVLKSNWLRKHLAQVPAAAILFFDMDWDDPQWADKRADCSARMRALRASLQGRNTKVALVLVQNNLSIPVGDNLLATERAHALCNACELPPKALFVLPYSDHLFGFILRLETAFLEITQGYYLNECKRVKAHKDFANKNTHQQLLIRHQFKIAFLHELKQDPGIAIRHYKQAYVDLLELKTSDANILEVKTVAGILNYKLCQLAFMQNIPLDAIHQFRRHVDIFKDRVGNPRLAFEHSAWMSKQFSHFGDLFEEAVGFGLTAIQTQHPGFYFQQAANHALARKEQAARLCRDVTSPPEVNLLEGEESLEFYGQRPWQARAQGRSDAVDPQTEDLGIQALQHREKTQVDHSALVVPLLSSAVAQFKKYRCPRMKRHLMVQIAEEYYSSRDYDKALSILTHVLWDYRSERWRPLVSNILTTALKCAYLSASVPAFLMLGLEFISSWIQGTQEEKSSIQTSIFNVIEGSLPVAFPGMPPSSLAIADSAWGQKPLPREPLHNLDMDHIIQAIECKVQFGHSAFYADQRVCLKVFLRSNCPLPIKASGLKVHFNNQHYNAFCVVEEGEPAIGSLHLVPRRTQSFSFAFLPRSCDINSDIQVCSVHVRLGHPPGGLTLAWNCVGGGSRLAWDPIPRRHGEEVAFHQLPQLATTRIHPRRPQVSLLLDHVPPVLVHEFYQLAITIASEEVAPLTDVCLSLGLVDDLDPKYYSTTHFTCEPVVPKQPASKIRGFRIEDIPAGGRRKQTVLLRNSEVGTRRVFVKVEYRTEVEVDGRVLCCSCCREIFLDLECIEPFGFSVKLLNLKFDPVETVRAEEQFVVQVDMESHCPLPLELISGSLKLGPHVGLVDKECQSLVETVKLHKGEVARDLFCLVAPNPVDAPTLLGQYTLQWKREGAPAVATHVVPLPSPSVQGCPLLLEVVAPAHGRVRTPLTVSYLLHNRTLLVQDVELVMDSSDAFMYSGNKLLHFRILPRECQTLTYNLYPLLSGYVALPRMHLVLGPGTAAASTLDALLGEMLPSHIFIMPQAKTVAPCEAMSAS